MSDGGPGFLDVLIGSIGGDVQEVATTGPLGAPATARVLVVTGGPRATAYVESAEVCGLHVEPGRRPWEATTAGLAPVLVRALELGVGRVVVGVGGTATTDGGRGLVEALGEWPTAVELVAATDVPAPLVGEGGAARGFAPQKGADDAMVEQLEARLRAWAEATGGDALAEGAGAGGGLGYGLTLLGARRVDGAQLVAGAVGLPARLAASELVVTGEGRFDWSSLRGKVVAHVASAAVRAGRPCVVLAGEVAVGRREAAAAGVDDAYAVSDLLGSVQASKDRPTAGLRDLAARVARQWSPGRGRPAVTP
jgi:glycerate kinase